MHHDDDPFRSVAELCHVPSPEEEHLRHCPFAFEMDDDSSLPAFDSSEVPVASAGIVMLSAPQTLGERQNGHNVPRYTTAEDFHTQPDVSGSSEEQRLLQLEPVASAEGLGNGEGIEAVDGDSVAVDLGRDTDLGFSLEAELTERMEIGSGMISSPVVCRAHESEVIRCESTDVRVSKRESTLNECVCESPVKKSKISDKDLEFGTPGSGLVGTCGGKTLKTSLNTTVKLIPPLNESNVLDKNLELEAPRGSLAAESRKTLSMYAKMLGKLSSSVRKSKDLDNNVAMETLRNDLDAGTEKSGEILEKSVDKSRVNVIDLCTRGSKLPQNYQSKERVVEMHDSNRECNGESSTKGKLEFSTEVLESGFQQINEDARNKNREEGISNSKIESEADQVGNSRKKNTARKSIDDIDKFRNVGPSGAHFHKTEKDAKGKRALPASVLGKENAIREGVECDGIRSPKDYKESTLLGILKRLAVNHHHDHDPSLENLSILEVAKRCGMTFP